MMMVSLGLLGALTACGSSHAFRSAPTTPPIQHFQQVSLQNQAYSPRATPEPVEWQTRQPNEVAPGYKLLIKNNADPNLNGAFQVDPKGKLKLPYDIEMNVEGLSLSELEEQLESRYREFIRSPDFTVEILEYDVFVNVQGLVTEPGTFLVKPEASLDQLISEAGGLQRGGQNENMARYIRISQLGKVKVVNLQDYFSGTPGLLPIWQGGETVFFQNEGPDVFSSDRQYVHVLGEISSPGAYPYRETGDLLAYLTEAGGPTDRANLNRITILARNPQGIMQSEYSLDEMGQIPAIQPGDTVIVQSSNPSDLERGSGIAASISAVLSSIGLIAIGL